MEDIEATETTNGYIVNMPYGQEEALKHLPPDILSLEIDLLDTEEKVIGRKSYRGNFTSTTAEIKKIFECNVDLFIQDRYGTRMLANTEYPLALLFRKSMGKTTRIRDACLIARVKILSNITIPFLDQPISLLSKRLQKLILIDCVLGKVSLNSLFSLKYIKIINCKLKYIQYSSRIVEFCDLSQNLLTACHVLSKRLILKSNQIKTFEQVFRFEYLNLSNNPLRVLRTGCRFLSIKHTLIEHVLESDAEILIADGTKKISFGNLPNIRILSVNDCAITQIGRVVRNLEIFKARNNYLQSLPKLNKCRVLDVSGNFIEVIHCKNVIHLDISKNQFRVIDLRNYRLAKHINLSFNPIERIYREKHSYLPRTILLNNTMAIEHYGSIRVKNQEFHQCSKIKRRLRKYKLETILDNTPVTLFAIVYSNKLNNFDEILSLNFDRLRDTFSILDIFRNLTDLCYTMAQATDKEVSIAFVLITNKFLFSRSFYIPLFLFSFAETEFLISPENVRIFKNVSNWCVFPLLCRHKSPSCNRCYSFFKSNASFIELFQFLGICCPKSLEFFISNSIEFYSLHKPRDYCKVSLLKEILPNTPLVNFQTAFDIVKAEYCNNQNEWLGFDNVDFGVNLYALVQGSTSSFGNPPIFLFMKLHFKPGLSYIIQAEKSNVVSIVDFYCKVFGGKIVEKNYRTFIIGFETSLHSALFGLRIQKVLKTIQVDISVGISGDAVFTTEHNGTVYLGGPVFNKASRMADLGIGVFCCGCTKLSSPSIEMIYEGERYLKGFRKSHQIYLLKISTEQL